MTEAPWSTAFSLVGGGVLVLALLCVANLLLAVHPPRFRSAATPADHGWPYERLTLRTADGVDLAAWYVPGMAAQQETAIVLLHGYPYDKGTLLSAATFLHERYDLIFFDFRSFGQSQGRATTLGARERLDLLAALEYLKQREKTRVGLYGFSLGASIALTVAPEAPAVTAVVADSPFASLELMAQDQYNPFWVLRYPLAWFTLTLARLYPGVDPWAVSPLLAAERWHGPTLLIHGTADSQIGVHHAYALERALRANSRAEVWLVEGADHTEASGRYRDAYQGKVLAFFGEHLSRLRNRE